MFGISVNSGNGCSENARLENTRSAAIGSQKVKRFIFFVVLVFPLSTQVSFKV